MLIQEDYFKNIFNTVREAILILDEDMRVLSANRSFFTIFKVDAAPTIGALLYDLGNGQWDIPHLRVLLEDILPKNDTVDDYEIEHTFESIGRKTMLLNACKIREKNIDRPIILLAIEDITERKEIEACLEKNRKELVVIKKSADEAHEFAESVINTVREPLISLDHDLRVVTVSRSFYEFFKVKPEETVGRLIYDLGNKQWDIPKLRELLETILPEKTSFDNYEVEHTFVTIGRRIMLLNARQIQRALGKKRIILLAIEDITERKRLEDLLKDSELQYRRIFETASDGIVLLEKREGRIVHANPAAEKMLGYSEEEYVGKMLQDIGVPLNMSDFSAIMQTLHNNGIINYDDVQVKNKSGGSIDTDIYLVDRAGLAQCNIRNITERKLANQDLQAALVKAYSDETRLEGIIAAMGEGITIQNTDYIILYQNKVQQDLVGDHLGEQCYRAYEHSDHVCEGCPLTMAYRDGGIHKAERSVTMGNETLHVELTASPLRDMQGNIVAGIELVRDVTDHKKLEAQLRHSQKMDAVGNLASGIAHDFNNILNVIMGYGSMVMDTLEPGTPSEKHMLEVLIAANRAANLTKRLLAFSRKQVAEVKPLNINELILGLQKMLVRIISENIECNLKLADSPLMVLADTGQMEQVLINLAANAKDAMQDGGRLTISTEMEEMDAASVALYGYGKPGRYALITVADTGQGMDVETQQKIFEPFFTTKGLGEGTGLGLSISYGIIKQHGGYIKVYSEPGHGASFKIYLPLSEESASPDKKTDAAMPLGGKETVLVAEDDASLRQLTRITLESFGYTVISAEDGEDAITKYMENRERINLVLIDMIMPKKNGNEVREALIKINPRIKMLFSSGYAMDTVMSNEVTEADFDFIRKPFLPKDLLMKVREILDR